MKAGPHCHLRILQAADAPTHHDEGCVSYYVMEMSPLAIMKVVSIIISWGSPQLH